MVMDPVGPHPPDQSPTGLQDPGLKGGGLLCPPSRPASDWLRKAECPGDVCWGLWGDTPHAGENHRKTGSACGLTYAVTQ